MNRVRTITRIPTALAGWSGLALLMIVNLRSIRVDLGLTHLRAILRSVSYFTVLCNLLVTVAVTITLLWPNRRVGRFFSSPKLLSGILACTVVVGLVYHLMLADVWNPQGMHLVADILQHYIVPISFLLHWIFIPKGTLNWKVIPSWLVFPVVYFLLIMVRGAIADVYPYPFIDVSRLGIWRVLINAVVITLGFAVVGSAVVALDLLLGRTRLSQ